MWAPLASGAYHGWPLAVTFLLVGLGVAAWGVAAVATGRLEWRRTPLDLPVALLLVLVAVQLAIGNRALVAWALAPAAPVTQVAADFPAPFLAIGTVAPRHTATAALTFAGYAAVYALVVQTVRTRRQVGRLVRTLLVVGGVVAFAGLVDYLTGEAALARLRGHAFPARLSGTFVNPDHFAAWLAMLVALGLGWMASRARASRRAPGLGALLSVRELREQAMRRHLPLVAVVCMAIALVFTLSRGGLVNVVVGLLTLLALLRMVGRVRRSLVVTGVLLIAVLGYGGWIGFGPVLARLAVTPEGTVYRLGQYVASLAMLREFPVLGVGLGAYREIYFRHQPLAHQPETLYFPYAHNDLLQLALELGPVGVLLGVFVAWRLAADLVGVHLLGRGACPVDGGVGPEAMRSDRTSLGIAIGALAGVAGLVAHSALDFSARIPAVGILAATLLGLATVALHTRLHPGHEQLLSGTATLDLTRPGRRVALGALAAVLVGGWTWTWAHHGRVHAAEAALLAAPAAEAPARAGALLALDARSPQGRLSRARARQAEAVREWSSPVSGVERESRARALLAQAREDLHVAIASTPSNPWLHLDLAWVEASDAVVQGRIGAEGLATALAHGARAVTLGRNSPLFYAGMARLAYSVPELSLHAAREGVARRASLMPEMVDLYRPLGLTESEWLTVVPATAVDRLELAILLERRGLGRAGLHAFRTAAAAAPAEEAGVYRWALGEALGRAGAAEEAVEVLRAARAADAGNVELARALGAALARGGDPDALDHLRAAAAGAERLASATDRRPFPVSSSRLAGLVETLADDLDRPRRYQRALATYLTERRLWEPALEQWRALLTTEPRDAEARFGRGLVLEATGAAGEALDDFRAAVTLDPRAPRYRHRLAARLWQSEQFFQAINEWRALKEQQPGDVDTRLALARAYERVGQPTDAYREFREVLALAPGQPDAARAVARMEGRGR